MQLKLTRERVALFHLALGLAGLVVLVLLASCYDDERPPDEPQCSAYGALVLGVDPGSSTCTFAQLGIGKTLAKLSPLPGFDRNRLDGYVIRIHPDSDGHGFKGADDKYIGGETDCYRKRISLARWGFGLEHEVGHAMQGCPRDEKAKTAFAVTHPGWAPSVCEAIRSTGAYEECGS